MIGTTKTSEMLARNATVQVYMCHTGAFMCISFLDFSQMISNQDPFPASRITNQLARDDHQF